MTFRINDEVESDYDGSVGIVTEVRPHFVCVRWSGDDFDCTEDPNALSLICAGEDPQLLMFNDQEQ